VDIELHPKESPIQGRSSLTSHGCVLLHYMPPCIYVRIIGCKDIFLEPSANAVSDLRGVIAIQPTKRQWKFMSTSMEQPVQVDRTQCPLLPRKQCTLHGVQGKTADPGIIAHWTFPTGLSKESIWLAYYVTLSRPRSFSKLLSHGLPSRDIIEAGPPKDIAQAFTELFGKKIAKTKKACVRARAEMKWPARRSTG
jgi:hypothetical protein